jgi:hypothetical protein
MLLHFSYHCFEAQIAPPRWTLGLSSCLVGTVLLSEFFSVRRLVVRNTRACSEELFLPIAFLLPYGLCY